MSNPYLAEFEALNPDWQADWLHRPIRADRLMASIKGRDYLTRKYAWAIPTDEAILAIVALSPIVEIGAGTGYWAKLLQEAGADVIAYDIAPPAKGNNSYRHRESWVEIYEGDAQSAAFHQDRTLFLCWPPYDEPMAEDALAAYRGSRLVYVGESCGGCNATKGFFEVLGKAWKCDTEIMLPQWDGIHDYLTIYTRKEQA